MLHSRVLRYIDEVARSGSIRAAGERLNVAASAINKHVLQLEEMIDEPLFERLPRGLRLTPAGEILVAHVRRTIKEYSQVEAQIRDLKALQSGEVIIATMNGLAGGIVPKAAANFCARHPRLKISIRVMFIHDIVQAVVDGEADLGLAFNLPPSPQLETLWKMDTRLGAVVSPEHPLVGLESLPLAHCEPYPLIFADRSMLIHGIVADAFANAGLTVEPAFLTNSIEAMKCLAAAGDGIAFLSKFDIAEEQRNGVLTYLQIRDRTFGKNVLSLVQREKRSHGLATSMFAEEIIRALRATMD
ncbi:LysR family transcriptional regulator [Ensifer sp. T173]|jgi:DNA-binding transcriptional LysR family regulator|uniref:LysR family transcriptional regulator n=1 Tax=Ensifer canadensis TaxID=555315 RepID=A0AAW4FTC0_9HYPH|nr:MULTISPECIES: LysR family transcriptional regulator [Ensifer]KQU88852.1 LysR family transcriptional regulator [Ensifer sp. Root31]MBM3094621.1 LysR family transcriptional regulator [Ensifer canadensis]UBI78582.1 LysR family transcriptional regulator [Ensifer canadensis]